MAEASDRGLSHSSVNDGKSSTAVDHERLPPTLVIAGPTAAGKTEIAMRLADQWPAELISADSAQVYRGLDVGTAKPDVETLRHYPHALIDIREPDQAYSAADFVDDATQRIHFARQHGRIPILVGGTTLYLNALRYGLDRLPPANESIRAALSKRAADLGWKALHRELSQLDPDLGRQIGPNDPQRIQRALEIHQITGRKPSDLMTGRGEDRMPDSLFLVITCADREVLHSRINRRWEQMQALGLVDEVRGLITRFPDFADLPAFRAVGYRQTIDYLDGRIRHVEWVAKGAAATRQLAKRQLTALRQFGRSRWYDPEFVDTMEANRLKSNGFALINKRVGEWYGNV